MVFLIIGGSDMLSPAEAPCTGLFDMISRISYSYAKSAVIEICDREIESCIADFCKRVGIQLVMKKQIKVITQARRQFWEK